MSKPVKSKPVKKAAKKVEVRNDGWIGTDKQVQWAKDIQQSTLENLSVLIWDEVLSGTSAWEELVIADHILVEIKESFEKTIKSITDAKWWIENKSNYPVSVRWDGQSLLVEKFQHVGISSLWIVLFPTLSQALQDGFRDFSNWKSIVRANSQRKYASYAEWMEVNQHD